MSLTESQQDTSYKQKTSHNKTTNKDKLTNTKISRLLKFSPQNNINNLNFLLNEFIELINNNIIKTIIFIIVTIIVATVTITKSNSKNNIELVSDDIIINPPTNTEALSIPSRPSFIKFNFEYLKDVNKTPITRYMLEQKYSSKIIRGFVPLSNTNPILNDYNSVPKNGKSKYQVPNLPIIGNTKMKSMSKFHSFRMEYNQEVQCQKFLYNGIIEYSENKMILKDDIQLLRSQLLNKPNNWLAKELIDKRDRYRSEKEILEKQWFRFGGSSVWLESEQCYVVFTRVVYSRLGRRNRPHVSLVRGQAFDKEWNEIIGKRIPYLDVNRIPEFQNDKQDSIGLDLNSNDSKSRIIMSRFYVTYPTVFDIPFGIDGDWNGPEDPHIILRKTNQTEEPILFLNMFDTVEGKRRMYSYMPHRRVDPLIKLTISDRILKHQEKNWSPFFHPSDAVANGISRGSIHFIYTFSPLDIIKCSLDNGSCEMIFNGTKPNNNNDLSSTQFDGIRGGTQFIPLPIQIPSLQNKTILVGFPKLHIQNCGCGEFFYRPMLVVLVESKGSYRLELIVATIDFDIDVLSWDMKSSECKETNIMSPNSIVHWNVLSHDPNTKQYDDYMTVTISESDSLTKMITLRGIADYISGIYNRDESMMTNNMTDYSDLNVISCVSNDAEQTCAAYGRTHPNTDTFHCKDIFITIFEYIYYIWITTICTLFP
ncbi:similar to Naumovozyma dairenensis NDAI_0G00360 hypothetical protein [Maudiozyma saulgeensis]|uniref:Uncharacterized protein n=1 Tax=Maudiozyma saulgeensis TaxID=1789683 RepID=A0A1X7R5T9_9SACH|nr:similar to Naumovozyma dairenensis NDAI_0G00360 hypothetical protein [Kazachstania saulgeensis]